MVIAGFTHADATGCLVVSLSRVRNGESCDLASNHQPRLRLHFIRQREPPIAWPLGSDRPTESGEYKYPLQSSSPLALSTLHVLTFDTLLMSKPRWQQPISFRIQDPSSRWDCRASFWYTHTMDGDIGSALKGNERL